MIYNSNLYTSRSAIETFQKCKRLYQYMYEMYGTGLVPTKPSRALEMGTALHIAMAAIWFHLKRKEEVPRAFVYELIEQHMRPTFEPFVTAEGDIWTLNKDINLVYGLAIIFLDQFIPDILKAERPLFVEEDTMILLPSSSTYLESKADLVTRGIQSKEYTVWNWKTTKFSVKEDGRSDQSFEHDLQGITESYVLEAMMRATADKLWNANVLIDDSMFGPNLTKHTEALKQYQEAARDFKITKIQYVMFLKGDEKKLYESDGSWNGKVINYSPLVRGYHTRVGASFNYAWTDKRVEPDNKSGFGKLGKAWESFDVWDNQDLGDTQKERMDTWLGYLTGGHVQKDLLDQGITPMSHCIEMTGEKFRSEEDTRETVRELIEVTSEMLECEGSRDDVSNYRTRTRKACTYPSSCPFKAPCLRGASLDSLTQIGELKRREPHHKVELELFKKVGFIKDGEVRVEETEDI